MANLKGKPLSRETDITDPEAVASALRLLYFGGDEDDKRSTQVNANRYVNMGGNMPGQWYEELAELDNDISEALELQPIVRLPTENVLEQIDAAVEALNSWYAAPVPVWQKRKLHYAFDEMAEVSSLLRAGKINVVEAKERFENVMAEAQEIVDFSKFMG